MNLSLVSGDVEINKDHSLTQRSSKLNKKGGQVKTIIIQCENENVNKIYGQVTKCSLCSPHPALHARACGDAGSGPHGHSVT